MPELWKYAVKGMIWDSPNTSFFYNCKLLSIMYRYKNIGSY